jgi:hypothetical protein
MRTFVVTIATPVGPLSVRLPTAGQAADRGRQLAAEGRADVTITDPDGRNLPLWAFLETYSDQLRDRDAPG